MTAPIDPAVSLAALRAEVIVELRTVVIAAGNAVAYHSNDEITRAADAGIRIIDMLDRAVSLGRALERAEPSAAAAPGENGPT